MDKYPSLKILLVDDIDVHRMLMRDGLSRLNPFLQFAEAECVDQAKEMLMGPIHFNAVICDRQMPGGEGTELAHWMRKMRCFDRLPFVVISGMVGAEDIIEAFMKHEIDGYVTKPFTHADLYDKLMGAYDKRSHPKAA